MTSKSMLSVERELIQWLVDSEDLLDFGGRESELRALLDKPETPMEIGAYAPSETSGARMEMSDEWTQEVFSKRMLRKLEASAAKGRNGWQQCSQESLSRMLREQVNKCDPVDVANFCMFLDALGYGIAPAAQHQDEPVACMPVDRCYDVRAKMIIAFNEAKKAGGDLDDALDAAYKSALRYSPNPMTSEQPVPVAVDTERLDFILSKSRTVTTEILPDGYALYVEEGLMGDKIYPHVKASTVGRENRKALQRQAIDLAIAEIRLNVAKS